MTKTSLDTAEDRSAAAIQAMYPAWTVWTVRPVKGHAINESGCIYCAQPPGCLIALCHAREPDDLVAEMLRWMYRTPAEIDAHVHALRVKLDSFPAHWARERAFLAARIESEGVSLLPGGPDAA